MGSPPFICFRRSGDMCLGPCLICILCLPTPSPLSAAESQIPHQPEANIRFSRLVRAGSLPCLLLQRSRPSAVPAVAVAPAGKPVTGLGARGRGVHKVIRVRCRREGRGGHHSPVPSTVPLPTPSLGVHPDPSASAERGVSARARQLEGAPPSSRSSARARGAVVHPRALVLRHTAPGVPLTGPPVTLEWRLAGRVCPGI